ncbi:hypothetical protein ACJX0J_018405, partial [Zea mays]
RARDIAWVKDVKITEFFELMHHILVRNIQCHLPFHNMGIDCNDRTRNNRLILHLNNFPKQERNFIYIESNNYHLEDADIKLLYNLEYSAMNVHPLTCTLLVI